MKSLTEDRFKILAFYFFFVHYNTAVIVCVSSYVERGCVVVAAGSTTVNGHPHPRLRESTVAIDRSRRRSCGGTNGNVVGVGLGKESEHIIY